MRSGSASFDLARVLKGSPTGLEGSHELYRGRIRAGATSKMNRSMHVIPLSTATSSSSGHKLELVFFWTPVFIKLGASARPARPR